MSWAFYLLILKRIILKIPDSLLGTEHLSQSELVFFIIYIDLDIFEDAIGIVCPHLPTRCVKDTLIPDVIGYFKRY